MQFKEASSVSTETVEQLKKMVFVLLDLWQLSPAQKATVIGVDHQAASSRVSGLSPELTSEQIERFGHLLGIHQRLRMLFPQNHSLAYAWATTHNRAFGNLAPIDVIESRGLSGLVELRSYLDGALSGAPGV